MRGSHVPDSMNEQFTGSTSVHRPESAEMGDEVGVSQSTLQHIKEWRFTTQTLKFQS